MLFPPLSRTAMGPNIIYDRAPNMTDANINTDPNGCQDRLAQDKLPWNVACQDPRLTTGSPVYHQHFERLPAEQEQQKFLLNNGIQLAECHPDVRRKLNEMFFRGTDLRYTADVNTTVATSLEQDQQS